MTTPFTYLITEKTTGKKYYGVRFAKGCHPLDLGATYFSSSEILLPKIKNNPNNFTYEVRKIFDDVNKARKWECKVLTRMKVTNSDSWYNQVAWPNYGELAILKGSKNGAYGKGGTFKNKHHDKGAIQKISNSLKRTKGISKSPRAVILTIHDRTFYYPCISEASRSHNLHYSTVRNAINNGGYNVTSNGIEFSAKLNPDQSNALNMGLLLKGKKQSDSMRRNLSKAKLGSFCITNGTSNKYLLKGEKVPQGWRVGRKSTETFKNAHLKSPTANSVRITNGKENKCIFNSAIPPDWWRGMTRNLDKK